MAKSTTKKSVPVPREQVPELADIELTKIDANPWQPRITQQTEEEIADLAASITAVGQLMPIGVRPHPTREGRYQRFDGAMRCLASARAGKKTVRAIIEPLTDKQMRIKALASSTFIRLQDSDKRKAVFTIWDLDYRTEDADVTNGKDAGIVTMSRESGIDRVYIVRCIQAQETLNSVKGNKELRVALKDANLSTKELVAIKDIVKDTPDVAMTLIEARTSNTPIKSKELEEIAQMVKSAPTPLDKKLVAEEIIQSKRDVMKEKAKIDTDALKSLSVRVQESMTPDAQRQRKDDIRTRLDDDQQRRESEIKKQVNADKQLHMRYFDIETQAKTVTTDTYFRRIANIRDENLKFQTVERIKNAAKTLSEFAARFKE
jgi:ParB-like chromosome segregation protein Spo0J